MNGNDVIDPNGGGGVAADGDEPPATPPNTTTLPQVVANNPRAGLAVAAGLAVVGFFLLAVAAERDRLWWLLLWFALGTVALSISLLYANDRLAVRLDALDAVPRSWWAMFFSVLAAGLLGLGGLVVAETGPVWATACVLLIAGGLIGIHVGASHGDPPTPPPDTSWWTAVRPMARVGLVVMAAASVVVGLLDGFGALAWVLVAVWIGGLVMLKIGVVPFLKSRHAAIRPTLVAMVVLTLAGVVVAIVDTGGPRRLTVLLGLSVIVGALSVVGLAVVHCDCSASAAWWMIGVGGAGIVGGTIWVIVVVNGWQLGLVVAAFVWGIGTWYVFRGEGIVLVLLVGFIAVYGVVDRTADADPDPHVTGGMRMLALGDSFISGEGATEFLSGTNVVGGDRPNECRRAATAYAYLVADELGLGLDFVACQGAKMRELTLCGQMATEGAMEEFGFADGELDRQGVGDDDYTRCTTTPEVWADRHRAAVAGEPPGYLPQLANFTADELLEFDVVVLSISGNDSGFSTIVKSCLLPQECSGERDAWFAKVASNRTQLRELYRRIRGAVRPDTPVIVMPYPRMVGREACSLGLSSGEHEFVADFIEHLDTEIARAAADAGVNFFEYSLDSFDGNQLCDGDKGANHLRLEPVEGNWAARYQPGKMVHGSMHPNELGHRRIADRLVPYVQELLDDVATGGAANPPDTGGRGEPLTPQEEIDAEQARGLLADRTWINERLSGTVGDLLPPVVLLLVAGIVFAAGLLRKDFWLANALRPRDAS